MKLSDSVVRTFKPVRRYNDNTDKINYMSMSPNGELLITSGNDDQMILYDLSTGQQHCGIESLSNEYSYRPHIWLTNS